jgi:hypothetical protein
MFDFLKKDDNVATTTENNMKVALIMEMENYIQEQNKILGKSENPDEDTRNLKMEYDRLLSAGLGNTVNAMEIKKKLETHKASKGVQEQAECMISYLKYIRMKFGDRAILLGNRQFHDILKKYNLSIGFLQDYTGVIPEKNIVEIEKANKSLGTPVPDEYDRLKTSFGLTMKDNNPWSNNNTALTIIEGISFKGMDFLMRKMMRKKLLAEIEDRGRLFFAASTGKSDSKVNDDGWYYLREVMTDYSTPGWYGEFYKLPENYKEAMEDFDQHEEPIVKLKKVSGAAFLIACPSKYLEGYTRDLESVKAPEPVREISKEAVDPIVFQVTPYGVLVHSVWGEEAEDKVFEEYTKINNLLSL